MEFRILGPLEVRDGEAALPDLEGKRHQPSGERTDDQVREAMQPAISAPASRSHAKSWVRRVWAEARHGWANSQVTARY